MGSVEEVVELLEDEARLLAESDDEQLPAFDDASSSHSTSFKRFATGSFMFDALREFIPRASTAR